MSRPPQRPCRVLLQGNVDVLLVTATQVETAAVLTRFRGGPAGVDKCNGWKNVYWDIGVVNGSRVVLVQTGMPGSSGISRSNNTVNDTITELGPAHIALVGIAY